MSRIIEKKNEQVRRTSNTPISNKWYNPYIIKYNTSSQLQKNGRNLRLWTQQTLNIMENGETIISMTMKQERTSKWTLTSWISTTPKSNQTHSTLN